MGVTRRVRTGIDGYMTTVTTQGIWAERFAVDEMLGRLARWLRVLGCDTLYVTRYDKREVDRLLRTGRLFITRQGGRGSSHERTILLSSERVGEQLRQLRAGNALQLRPHKWFSRCLRCNTALQEAAPEQAQGHVPEYVYQRIQGGIRLCPVCQRFYWPGTHRTRMLHQLGHWGIIPPQEAPSGQDSPANHRRSTARNSGKNS